MLVEQSSVKITFITSDKVIELTSDEFEELKSYFKEVVYIPSIPPVTNPNWPYTPPVVPWGTSYDSNTKAK